MKKAFLLFICVVMLLGTLTACGEKSTDTTTATGEVAVTDKKAYLGKFVSSEAKVMGADASVEIREDGTFTMIAAKDKTKSTITGTYRVFSPTELLFLPEKQVLVQDGKKQTNDMKEAASTLATLEGDDLIFSTDTTNQATYTRVK